MKKATLRLFNSIYTDIDYRDSYNEADLSRMVSQGFLFAGPPATPSNLMAAEKVFGLTQAQANAAFHKSWETVRDTPIEVMVVQQIVHYITTYGFHRLGIYHESTVFIPHEEMDAPAITEDLPFVVITAINASELYKAMLELSGLDIAMSEQDLDDYMVIVREMCYTFTDFTAPVKNRELRARLHDYFNIAPHEPEDYMRWLVHKLTGESMPIANDYLIGKLKEASSAVLHDCLAQAPHNLASIFRRKRYKPLFLAMKKIACLDDKAIINKLNKDARKMHKPLQPALLDNVVTLARQGNLNLVALEEKLKNTSFARKVRLANALTVRLNQPKAMLYLVRNGRAWVKEPSYLIEPNSDVWWTLLDAMDIVTASLVDSLSSVLKTKEVEGVYIPENIVYALPYSLKKYIGNIPIGSYIKSDGDMLIGIHWTNIKQGKSIDLDLSTIDTAGKKVGWDGSYRNGSVLFSGDLVDAPAPKGATEFVRVHPDTEHIVNVNWYNNFEYSDGTKVPAKIIAAPGHEMEEDWTDSRARYIVDLNKAFALSPIILDQEQTILGIYAENRFYFHNASIGMSITSRGGDYSTDALDYLLANLRNQVTLNSVLKKAGVRIFTEKPEPEEEYEYIDLSPERLRKTTLLDLFEL